MPYIQKNNKNLFENNENSSEDDWIQMEEEQEFERRLIEGIL